MVNTEECLQLLRTGAITTPDADISGKGVILAFLISAYLSFAAVLVAYMTGMVEDELLSSVDKRVMRIRSRKDQFPRVHETLRHIILLLSDQQIVTGIAIMAAGFAGLQQGKISVYHYQIVLYLAWLSSSVHLSALTLLRPFLNKHQDVRAWRLLGMIVLFFMLIIGLVPTVSYDWGIIYSPEADTSLPAATQPTGWGVPAICFWDKTYGDGVNNDAPIGYLILVLSYIWKMGDLFEQPRNLYNRGIRRPLERLITRALSASARRYMQDARRRWLWCFRALLIPCIPFIAFMEVLASFSASLWLSALGLVFGTIQIVIPRAQNLAQTASKEDEWGFGQLVPLILLIQPLGAISEHGWVRKTSANRESTHEEEYATSTLQLPYSTHSTVKGKKSSVTDQAGAHAYNRPLIEVIGYEQNSTSRPVSEEDATFTLTDVLLSSRLFGFIVVLLHLTILSGACVILYFDANTIGFERGQNWSYALIAVACYTVSSWIAILSIGPFSRLGGAASQHDRIHDCVFELVGSFGCPDSPIITST